MKIRVKSGYLFVNDEPMAAIKVMCGESLFEVNSWKNYPMVWRPKGALGVGIGPVLFWSDWVGRGK